MLQEEAVKRLSNLIHSSFSKAHVNEFLGHLDIKLDGFVKDE